MKSKFALALEANITAKIKALKADGITAMSLANLVQVTKTPPVMAGAPAGPAGYKELFAELVAGDPAFSKFASL